MAVLMSTVHVCSGQDLIYSPELMISEILVHGWLTTLLVCLRLVARQNHRDGGGCVAAELFTMRQPGNRKCSSDPVLMGIFLFSILFPLVPIQSAGTVCIPGVPLSCCPTCQSSQEMPFLIHLEVCLIDLWDISQSNQVDITLVYIFTIAQFSSLCENTCFWVCL